MKGESSIKEAKEKQDELWNEIYKMKKRTSGKKIGKKFSIKNKKIILNLIKVGSELYNIRDKIINAFEKKEIVEPSFEWIRDTEAFNEVLYMEAFNKVLYMVEDNIGLEAITDSKIVNLKRVSKFMDAILSGKINNKYDAEKIYREIMKDENLLRNYKYFSRNKNAVGYAVFGPLLPSKYNADDIENVDIRDMPDLESEEDVEKNKKDMD